jgi:hypothetical protein
MFKDFAKSTIINVTKKLIGPIENQEVRAKIAADSQIREMFLKRRELQNRISEKWKLLMHGLLKTSK